MATSIDGLVSGLDTTTLISSIMAVEALPQGQLQTKVSESQTYISLLQRLNTSVAALGTSANTAAKATSLDLFTVTSSSTAVTATAGTGASAGSLDIVVDKVATSQASVTAALSSWPAGPAALTFVSASGTVTEVTPAGTSIDDVITAVNASDAGISAVKVSAGTDGLGAPLYRIQFTSATTGAAGGFTAYAGTAADVTAGTASDLMAAPGAATLRSAQDAQITLFAGTAAAQVITSAGNTFDSVLTGISLTVSAASTTPVTIGTTRNSTAAVAVANTLVTSLNATLSLISTNSAVSSSGSGGSTAVTAGQFTGDSLARSVQRAITEAASYPVNGLSPSEIGISIQRDGSFAFDTEKFQAALSADPAKVQSMLSELSSRIETATKAASDKYDGTITLSITSQQGTVRNLTEQIDNWDIRLESRRSLLEKTYAALEVRLSTLNAQSSWLSSQIASFTSSSDS